MDSNYSQWTPQTPWQPVQYVMPHYRATKPKTAPSSYLLQTLHVWGIHFCLTPGIRHKQYGHTARFPDMPHSLRTTGHIKRTFLLLVVPGSRWYQRNLNLVYCVFSPIYRSKSPDFNVLLAWIFYSGNVNYTVPKNSQEIHRLTMTL